MKKKQNIRKLEFTKEKTASIKGVAILMMLLHHCFTSPERYKGFSICFFPFREETINSIAFFCKTCVGMFVFLSGYGMTKSFDEQNLEKSSVRRYKKLMLQYIYIFLFCQIFCFFYDKRQLKIYKGGILQGIIEFVLDGMGLADLFGTPMLVATWWYMSLSIVLIVTIPIILFLYNKIGTMVIPIVILLPRAIGLEVTDTNIIRYLLAFTLGIVCAKENLFERISLIQFFREKIVDKGVRIGVEIIILYILYRVRSNGNMWKYYELCDGIIPSYVVYFCFDVICAIKILQPILQYLGKHSMNIFLIHSFIRGIYFKKFLYGLTYAPLIFVFLLGSSLIVSIAINAIESTLKKHIKLKHKNVIV